MDDDRARQLFESGGILLVLDAPKEMEFGIDMYSWQIGPQFQGIKMIPPGLHLCHYAERDLSTKELSHRQSFFVEFRSADQLFSVVRWSPMENLFQREHLNAEQYETRRNQRYELDRLLGQYPLETYRQWLALSNHLQWTFVERILPPSGHICSANVFEANKEKKNKDDPIIMPKNLQEAESRLPKLTVDSHYALRFTPIEKNVLHQSGSALTQSKLDRTDQLESIINERFDSQIFGVLCEFQLSFLVFLLAHVYDGFEQWKSLLHLICSCRRAFTRWPSFYIDFLQTIYFHLKQFSSLNDDNLLEDIDQQENYIHKCLENLFANVATANAEDEQMEGDDREKLVERCDKMKKFLLETYHWTFDDEPDDEKPVVVQLESQ